MKGFVLSFVLLSMTACAFAEPPPEVRQYREECSAELGITGKPPRDDPKAKCFHACVMKKSGKMEGGKVVLEKELEGIMKRLPNADDTVKQKISTCVDQANAETDECEVAHVFKRCLKDSGIFPHHGPPAPSDK